MDPSHLDQLVELEDNYWWHVAKRELVTNIVRREFPPPAKLVEGGIGSARNLVEFNKLGYEVIGFDLMPESVAHATNHSLRGMRARSHCNRDHAGSGDKAQPNQRGIDRRAAQARRVRRVTPAA